MLLYWPYNVARKVSILKSVGQIWEHCPVNHAYTCIHDWFQSQYKYLWVQVRIMGLYPTCGAVPGMQ